MSVAHEFLADVGKLFPQGFRLLLPPPPPVLPLALDVIKESPEAIELLCRLLTALLAAALPAAAAGAAAAKAGAAKRVAPVEASRALSGEHYRWHVSRFTDHQGLYSCVMPISRIMAEQQPHSRAHLPVVAASGLGSREDLKCLLGCHELFLSIRLRHSRMRHQPAEVQLVCKFSHRCLFPSVQHCGPNSMHDAPLC